MEVVKIGNVSMFKGEAKKIYDDKKYVCSYTGIYQVHYSVAQKSYYGHKVINYKGYARRGRYYIQSAKEINNVLGKTILNEN